MKRVITIVEKLSGLGGWMAGIMICLALGLVIAEILLRSILDSTLYVSEEYSGYLMCMLTFCALAYTLRERGHIRMVFLQRSVKGRARVILDMICFVIGLVFCLGLTYYAFFFFWDSVVTGSQSMRISETYLAIPQAFMPFGALLMTLQFLGEFLKSVCILTGRTEGLRILEDAGDLGR